MVPTKRTDITEQDRETKKMIPLICGDEYAAKSFSIVGSPPSALAEIDKAIDDSP